MESLKPSTETLILDAAQAVFLEKGLAGARMQEIADRAGINKALLHYYFRSKDKLSELIINRAVGAMMPRLMAILEADLDLFEKIRQLTSEYISLISQRSFMPLFIVNEVNRNPQFFFQGGHSARAAAPRRLSAAGRRGRGGGPHPSYQAPASCS